MAIKSSSGIKTDNDNLFVANGNQEITADLHNEYNEDVADSYLNRLDDADQHAFKGLFNANLSYLVGDIVVYFDRIMVCMSATSGAFVTDEWRDYDEYDETAGLAIVNITVNTIDLSGMPSRHLILDAAGVITLNEIQNGIHGKRYRIYLAAAITDFSITSNTVGTVVSNGTGEIAMGVSDEVPNANDNMRGHANPVMSDWFEFTYQNVGGKEYNSVYKIQKHTT